MPLESSGGGAPNAPGFELTLPAGSELTGFAQAANGSGVTFLLKGNTLQNPYTWTGGNVPAGTYLGGVRFKGQVTPTRKTYSGSPGAASQLTAAQLAGTCAVIQVISGSTVNYSAGSAGYGMDGIELEDVVVTGATMGSTNSFVNDTSATVTCRRVKVFDLAGNWVKYCYHYIDDANIYCASSAGVTTPMGIFAPVYYTALRWPIHDYFSSNHIYVGGSGPLAENTGQYEDWIVADGIDLNPSGLYSQDVGFDLEFGSSKGLRSFTFGIIRAKDTKAFYGTNVGTIRGQLIDHRITRHDGSAPGNLPAGPDYVIASAGTSGIGTGALDVDIQVIKTVHEANTSALDTNSNRSVAVINLADYSYLGKWHIGTLSCILNGSSMLHAPTHALGGIVRLLCPSQASANAFFDNFIIDKLEIGYNLSTTNPTSPPSVVSMAQFAGAGAGTAGRLRVGEVRFLGATGPTAQTWAPTTAVAFTPTYEGTYSIAGGAVTGISINGTSTGVTAGAWHLQITDSITVTFTGSPTFNFYQGTGEPTTAGDGTHALCPAVFTPGAAGITFTLASEEFGIIDSSQLAAAALTTVRTAPAGTWTSTRRSVQALSPPDAGDTVTYTGTGFTYTHGATNLVTKGKPADGPATMDVVGGTLSNVTKNGKTISAAAVAGGLQIELEVGDALVFTSSGNPTINIVGIRRLGS